MRVVILVPGRYLGMQAGIFGAQERIWANGRAFWRLSTHLSIQAGILARVWARGQAFWCLGTHLGIWVGVGEAFCAWAGKVPETQINVF